MLRGAPSFLLTFPLVLVTAIPIAMDLFYTSLVFLTMQQQLRLVGRVSQVFIVAVLHNFDHVGTLHR